MADSPAQAAKNAAIVLAMLADDAASRAAWLGQDGALAAMPPGSIAVECSTLSPDWIRELHEAVTQRGLRMAEAPVTGSRTQAEAGQLNFLVGADEETLAADLACAAMHEQRDSASGPSRKRSAVETHQ